MSAASGTASISSSWHNRTVIGAGVTSFLADVGYESATAILPNFLLLLGLPPDVAAPRRGGALRAIVLLAISALAVAGLARYL